MAPTSGEENTVGIQDRDYYWEHRKKQEGSQQDIPSGPPVPRWLRLFRDWNGAGWVLFAFVLLIAYLLKHR